jgi:uncharacterized protein (DUF2062 family)
MRRPVARAFGTGLAICFVPLPIHLPLAALLALTARVNVPTIVATVMLVNPFTIVPVYYFAYRVGVAVTHYQPQPFSFSLSWDWLQYGLGPAWRPFLMGCAVCAVGLGLAGCGAINLLWRWAVRRRRRERRVRIVRHSA